MIRSSLRSGLVSMYTEAEKILDGLAEETYLSSFLESTGEEPPFLRITHSSMYPLWSGSTIYTQPLYSTRYRWDALYEAWKLAIPLRNWHTTSDSPLKETQSTAPTASRQYRLRLRMNLPSTASMMCTCANKFSLGSLTDTPNPNCV